METLSVIVPAHNEEAHIGRCLESIRRAAQRIPNPVEIVVALNRCDDGTGDIARRYDALLVTEDARNLARIRNAGVRKSQGGIVVTIDADSWMSDNMLFEVTRRLARGRDVGGGVMVHFERMSAGMLFSLLTFAPKLLSEGLWAGLFWTKRSSFDAVGGFNEEMVSAEDVDFARRLKAYGARRGLRYGVILRAHITTSARKFDRFGDWHLFRNREMVKQLLSGRDPAAADRYYYDRPESD